MARHHFMSALAGGLLFLFLASALWNSIDTIPTALGALFTQRPGGDGQQLTATDSLSGGFLLGVGKADITGYVLGLQAEQLHD